MQKIRVPKKKKKNSVMWAEAQVCKDKVEIREREDVRPLKQSANAPINVDPSEQIDENEVVGQLTIRGLNGSRNEVEVDLRLSASDACYHIGRVLGVKLLREFGLAYPEKRGWLDEEWSLFKMGIRSGHELVYKKKYFIADEEISRDDEVDISFMFPQCVEGFINGAFRCSQGHAIGLAALRARVFQAEGRGNLPSVSEMAEFLPPDMRNGATVKCVIDQVEGMKTLPKLDAMYQFVHVCSTLPGYGITAYVVGDACARRAVAGAMEKIPVLLGVGRDGIFRINQKTKETMESFSLNMIDSWSCGKQTFVIDFGTNRPSGHWGVVTRSGRIIGQIIGGYQRLLKERSDDLRKRSNNGRML